MEEDEPMYIKCCNTLVRNTKDGRSKHRKNSKECKMEHKTRGRAWKEPKKQRKAREARERRKKAREAEMKKRALVNSEEDMSSESAGELERIYEDLDMQH